MHMYACVHAKNQYFVVCQYVIDRLRNEELWRRQNKLVIMENRMDQSVSR